MRDTPFLGIMPALPRRSSLAVALLVCLAVAGLWPAVTVGADAKRFVTLDVGESCTAPTELTSNYCSLTGTLPGLAVDASNISWEVTLFYSDLWRVQFQAFSEGTAGECLYPIRIWGSYEAPGLEPVTLVRHSPTDLGITPSDYPSLTLNLVRVRIDTGSATCG